MEVEHVCEAVSSLLLLMEGAFWEEQQRYNATRVSHVHYDNGDIACSRS